MANYPQRQSPPPIVPRDLERLYPQPPQQVPPPPRRRFRWWIVLVPLTILLIVWFTGGVEPAFSWDDIMHWLHVHDRDRYTRLATLGVVLVAVVLIIRILNQKHDDEG